MMGGQERQAGVILTADTSDYQQNVKSSAADTRDLSSEIDKLSQKMSSIAKVAGGSMIGIAAADVATITSATAAYAAHEEQLSSLQAQAAVTGRSFETMSAGVDRLRRSFPTSTAEAGQLIGQLARMRDGTTPVNQLADSMMKLGGATGESVGGLTSSLLNLQRVMGSPQSDTKRYANVLATLGSSSQAGASGIADFANQLAPLAKTAGMSTSQVLGVSKAFTDVGQDGFRAANAFNQMLYDITSSVQTGSPDIAKYANLIGVTTDQFKKMNAGEYMPRIFEQINKMGPGAIDTLNRMGIDGIRAVQSIQSVAQSGGLQKAMDAAGVAYGQPGQKNLEKGAAAAYGGIIDETKKFRSNLAEIAEGIGQIFAPVAETFMKGVNLMLRGIHALVDSPLGELAGKFSAAFAPLAAGVGALTMGAPALMKLAGIFQLIRGSHTMGFKDARSGFEMGTDAATGLPMVVGGAGGTTRELTDTGKNYRRLNMFQRGLYQAGMFAGGVAPAYNAERSAERSLASRAAGVPFRLGGAAANLGASFMSPLAYGAITDMSQRETLTQPRTLGDWKLGRAPWFDAERATQYYAGQEYAANRTAGRSRWQSLRNAGLSTWGTADTLMAAQTAAFVAPTKMGPDHIKSLIAAERKANPQTADEFKALINSVSGNSKAVKESTDSAEKIALEAKTIGRHRGEAGATAMAGDLLALVGLGGGGGKHADVGEAAAETSKKVRTFGTDIADGARGMGKFVAMEAKATAGLGRLAAGLGFTAAMSAGRSALSGGLGLIAGMSPLLGVGLGAGALALGYNAWRSHQDSLSDQMGGPGNTLVEGWTGKINYASATMASAASTLEEAQAALPQPTTLREAKKVTEAELQIANHPDYQLHNQTLANVGPAQARAALAMQYQDLAGDPGKYNEAQLDLISKFGKEQTNAMFEYAKQHSGVLDVPSVLKEIYKQDSGDREKSFKQLSLMIGDQRDAVASMKDSRDQVGFARDVMGDYMKTMQRRVFPTESARIGYADPGMVIDDKEAQSVANFKNTFFPGLDVGYFKHDPFKDVEVERAMELVNKGKTQEAISNLIGQAEDAGQYAAVKQYETPQQRKRRRIAEGKDPHTGEYTSETDAGEVTTINGQQFTIGLTGELVPYTPPAKPKPPPGIPTPFLPGVQLDRDTSNMYNWMYGGTPGQGWSTPTTADDFTGGMAMAGLNLPIALSYERGRATYSAVQSNATPAQQYQGAMEQADLYQEQGARGGLASSWEALSRIGDENNKLFQVIQMGMQRGQQLQGYDVAEMGRVQQGQFYRGQYQTMTNMAQQNPAILNTPGFIDAMQGTEQQFMAGRESQRQFYTGVVQAFREFDVSRRRGEEDFDLQRSRMEYQFNLQQARALHDFNLQRERSEHDYELQRSRAEQDFNIQQRQAQFDYNLQRQRAEADFNRQQRRASADFHRQEDRSTQDYYRNKRRQEFDFQLQVQRMIEDTAKSAQSIYERITVKPTWSAEGLLANAQEQLDTFEEQSQNLRKARKLGLSKDVIQQLNLTDPQEAQQLDRLVEEMSGNPRLVKQYNRNIQERLKAVGKLVKDQDSSQWDRMVEDHRRSVNRADEDFQRAMGRSTRDFLRVTRQQREDFGRSMDRQAEDFERSMNRSQRSFDLGMDRMATDYDTATDRMLTDFNTSTSRAAHDFGIQLKQMRDDFNKQMDRAQQDLNRMAKGVEGDFENIMTRAINRLSGGARDMAVDVNNAYKDLRTSTTRIATAHMKDLYQIYGLNWKERNEGGGGSSGRQGGNTMGTGSGRVTQSGMAEGGTIPGWSPGQDIHTYTSRTAPPLALSGGESVMVPQFTQAMGGERGIRELNKMAREGKIGNKFFLGGTIPLSGAHWDRHSPSEYSFANWAGDFNVGSGRDDYGMPIHAWKPGKVSGEYFIGDDSYGRWVTVDHKGGEMSLYAHMSRFGKYQKGDDVRAGDVLGYVGDLGNTGTPPTSHLHFEIRGGHSDFSGQVSGQALKAMGSVGKAILAANLHNLPGLKDHYPEVEKSMHGPVLAGMGEDAMSGVLNRLYKQRARQMISRRGLPGAQGSGLMGAMMSNLHGVSGDYGGNARGVWNALRGAGFNAVQAAGIMGNMQSESGFDPFIVEGGGHSMTPGSGGYGLVQWTPGTKLLPYLHGQPPSVASEVNALSQQLQGKGPSAEGAAGAALRRARTVAEAARAFEMEYERHAPPPQPNRVTQAQAIHRKFAAHGGIFTGAHEVTIGENGPEMLMPLDHRGVDFLTTLMNKYSPGMEARGHPVRGSIPANTTNYYSYRIDHSTTYSGDITVQSQDPNEMQRKLEAKRRMQALTQPVLSRRP